MDETKWEPLIQVKGVFRFLADDDMLEHSLEEVSPVLVNESMFQNVMVPHNAVVEENSKQSDIPIAFEYYFKQLGVGANCVEMSKLSHLVTRYKIHTKRQKSPNEVSNHPDILTHVSVFDKHRDDIKQPLTHFGF